MSALPAVNSKAEAIERVVIQGDLSKLSPEERVNYYKLVCESVGLNPLTKPFEFIVLNQKLTLYALKGCTDQLRQNHQVSIAIQSRETTEDCYVVTARATLPSGRTDESLGAVPIGKLQGEARANAMMKCETKAKRRVTLSICGLGMLDETEIETIPSAKPEVQRTTAPTPIARTVAPVMERQPGEDDEDAIPALADAIVEKTKPETIDGGRQANFARAFRMALPKKFQNDADAERLKHDWLGMNAYVDDKGNPTSKEIELAEFEQVKKEACEWARSAK